MLRIASCDLTFKARFILFINVLSQRFQSSLKSYDLNSLKIKYFSFLIVKNELHWESGFYMKRDRCKRF